MGAEEGTNAVWDEKFACAISTSAMPCSRLGGRWESLHNAIRGIMSRNYWASESSIVFVTRPIGQSSLTKQQLSETRFKCLGITVTPMFMDLKLTTFMKPDLLSMKSNTGRFYYAYPSIMTTWIQLMGLAKNSCHF